MAYREDVEKRIKELSAELTKYENAIRFQEFEWEETKDRPLSHETKVDIRAELDKRINEYSNKASELRRQIFDLEKELETAPKKPVEAYRPPKSISRFNFLARSRKADEEKKAFDELFKGAPPGPPMHPEELKAQAKSRSEEILPVSEQIRRQREPKTEAKIGAGMRSLFGAERLPEGKVPEKSREERIEELQERLLEVQTRLAEKQLEAQTAGGGRGGEGTGGGAPTGEGGSPTIIPGPRAEELAKKQREELAKQTEFKAQFKHESKQFGTSLGLGFVSAIPIVVVAYFFLNNWIALGVNLLPAPVGPLLNSLWWVAYLAIFLLSGAILAQGKSPSTIVFSGVLIAVIIGLVFGWLLNIFVDFLGPFVGPGLTCTLLQLKSQQQGGTIPIDCFSQSQQTNLNNVQKTGSVNLLSVSIGQSGVPFPQPRKGQLYQFPITITNPSEFDIGPIVVEGGYMCNKTGVYPTCGGVYPGPDLNFKNKWTLYYKMYGSSCKLDTDKCVIGSGGPPLIVSFAGSKNNPVNTNAPEVSGQNIPFDQSYVNIYANVRYPFKTAGTNDYYIVKTSTDVPKSAPSCQGTGSRELGKACTGSGPLNVIPSFSESQYTYSSDQLAKEGHNVILSIYLSNIGDGTARIRSIKVSRFTTEGTQQGLIPNENPNCQLPGGIGADGKSIKFNEGVLYSNFAQDNLASVDTGDTTGSNNFLVQSKEAATFICNYKIDPSLALTGPSLDVKVEAQVEYDYYETASKTDILVCSSTGSCNTA